MLNKNIHFVWISRTNKELPAKCAVFIKEWEAMYPDWNVTLWDNSIISTFNDDKLTAAWADLTLPEAQVCNRLRLLLVQKYGGIYADVDTKPIKNMTSLLEKSKDFVVGLTQLCTSAGARTVDCNLFYACKGNVILQEILAKFEISRRGNFQINSFIPTKTEEVTLCPITYFQAMKITSETYTLHWPYRLASWIK
jgi:hypothetical protein